MTYRAAAVALLLVALAGCSDAKQRIAGLPVDADGDVLPTVEGFVVDEAIRPLAGATVRVLFEDVNATTDTDGHYALRRPTGVAKPLFVSASAPGYTPRTQQVQASQHVSSRMDFRLEPDPYQVPRVEVLSHRGSLGCQLHAGTLPVAQRMGCEPPSYSLERGIVPPTFTQVWAIDTTRALAGAVVQVHWDAESPLSQRLHVVLRGPALGCCNFTSSGGSPGEVQAEATGTSPLALELPEAAARAFPDWSALRLEVSLPPQQEGAPASFSRSQAFDAYASLFYVDPAPPGYRLS